jgi:hypothetical protein
MNFLLVLNFWFRGSLVYQHWAVKKGSLCPFTCPFSFLSSPLQTILLSLYYYVDILHVQFSLLFDPPLFLPACFWSSLLGMSAVSETAKVWWISPSFDDGTVAMPKKTWWCKNKMIRLIKRIEQINRQLWCSWGAARKMRMMERTEKWQERDSAGRAWTASC